ncbi:MAG: ATP-binding cassette domain-containing protein [Hyphomicrobiaceae bacterium]|nr:ATP-binding cassette domain-containing protein [Hyphomicrobiaceae bacterium]MCC0024144.1 ATP-binding cassette domain-containing protein [Hyphomicrobiaceae bacterium]
MAETSSADSARSGLRVLSEADKPAEDLRPLRQLLPFVLRYPTRLALTMVFLLIAAVAQLFIPVMARGLVDQGFLEQNLEQVAGFGWLILLVAAISALAGGARFYFISVIGERVLTDIRTAVFNHLLELDSTFFDTHRTGELTSRLNGDVATVRGAIGSSATLALRSGVMFIGSVILMFLTSWQLALAVVIGIPALVFPILYFARRLRKMSRRTQDALADLSAMATEVLSSTKTIKAFTQEGAQAEVFDRHAEASYDAEVVRLRARSILIAIVTFVGTGAIVLLLWWGAKSVFDGTVTAGQLTQFLIYALMASMSLTNVSEIMGSLQTVAGATERLIEILNTPSRMKIADNPVALPQPPLATVTFEHVGFSYLTRGNEVVLRDVSFSVGKGETVAIVGPSGAGKSTIFALLQRFYDPTKGVVRVDGVDILDAHPRDLRQHFAYVEQESTIFAGTVADNIRFGKPEASMDEIIEAGKAALVDEFVSSLPHGYDTIVGERGVMLSGGQKQRIAIARALLKDAPILLLDEATSALDAQSERLVQTALERLMQGRTTLVIAHRLATIRDADRILVLDGGELIAEGTHAELMKQGGRYAELAKLQFEVAAE